MFVFVPGVGDGAGTHSAARELLLDLCLGITSTSGWRRRNTWVVLPKRVCRRLAPRCSSIAHAPPPSPRPHPSTLTTVLLTTLPARALPSLTLCY
ncbi:hypothetical protein E2C01_027878 [Portunus trituberculatus]|uniref:Uncharacterized protein n=1 Tax=Portunus trituberculatus TaxID=210409 RepID=A0A5B7EMR1_PORTR|nr:hypothetical protein [Portunus trituberculatus]